MNSIAIVGASLAGVRAVAALRRAGFAGAVTVVGDEAAAPYDRPPLTKQVLLGRWPPDRTHLLSELARDELDVEWRLGVAAVHLDLADRCVRLADGEAVEFDGLIIATGARPRWLPATQGVAGVHVVRTLNDAASLQAELTGVAREVVVVGAGFIGTEVAAACRAHGSSVTLVDPLPAPLGRVLPPVLGDVVAGLHREHGVRLSMGTAVGRIETDATGRVTAVLLDDGTQVPASIVVLGLGVTPNVEWLADSGLTLRDGVVCDQTCLATPGVVVAGDVARWASQRYRQHLRVEHWTHTVEQAEYAARRLLLDSPPSAFDPVPYVWSDQYGHKLQLVGQIAPRDDVLVVDGAIADRRFIAICGRDGEVTGVLGMNRPALLMRWRARLATGVSWREAILEQVLL